MLLNEKQHCRYGAKRHTFNRVFQHDGSQFFHQACNIDPRQRELHEEFLDNVYKFAKKS